MLCDGQTEFPANGHAWEAKREAKTRIAPRSSEKEDSPNLKPFVGNPAGNQSRPAKPGQQPEASLAWWVGNCPCEA
jgi:hypothetical protein